MRILVLHPGALGDLILAIPALAMLRKACPESEIVGFARFPVWRYSRPNIVYRDLERGGIHRLFSSTDSNITGSADMVITWMGSQDAGFINNLSSSTGARVYAFSPNPPPENKDHVSRYLIEGIENLLINIGRKPSPDSTFHESRYLIPRSEDETEADNLLKNLGISDNSSLLVLHPGSGAKAKCWPPERFAEIAGRWRDTGKPVLLLEGPADEEAVEKMQRDAKYPVLKNAQLGVIISLLSRCEAYLGNDSGITHLAAGAGVNVVALFGPTDPHIWGPLGRRVNVISSSADCAPCKRTTWSECVEETCMQSIKANDVWNKIRRSELKEG